MASTIAYSLIAAWLIFAVFYSIKRYRDPFQTNPRVLESIPPVFTTLGVFGTFLGIFFGLQRFNVNDITASIPTLLEGLKTAFLTSIVGISLSLVFAQIVSWIQKRVDDQTKSEASDELDALNRILNELQEMSQANTTGYKTIENALVGENERSVGGQLSSLRLKVQEDNAQLAESSRKLIEQNAELIRALGGDADTSLLSQMKKMRIESDETAIKVLNGFDSLGSIIKEYGALNAEKSENVVQGLVQASAQITKMREGLDATGEAVINRMDSLGETLAKNNTEALVHVMKAATEQFNAQMTELIDRLVKENFQELNNSVKKMNDWQVQNKAAMESLVQHLHAAEESLLQSSTSLKGMTESTQQLVASDGFLRKVLEELHEVMAKDTGLKRTAEQLLNGSKLIQESSAQYSNAAVKMGEWVQREEAMKAEVARLIAQLKELEKIRAINGEFWKETREHMEAGVSIIKSGAKELEGNLDGIKNEFYRMLDNTLQNLDSCIQSMMNHYDGQGRN